MKKKKIYTKKGDFGETSLLYGGRVSKNSLRCRAYGDVDEAGAFIGMARAQCVLSSDAVGRARTDQPLVARDRGGEPAAGRGQGVDQPALYRTGAGR